MLENIINCEGKNCDREKGPRQWAGYEWWDIFSREWLLKGKWNIQKESETVDSGGGGNSRS